ncbi:MAG: CdaR family protein [bacterium]
MKLKKRLLNNYPLKVLSIAIAVGLWWYVYAEHHPRYETEISVKVRYANLPRGLEIESAPERIDLRLVSDPRRAGAITAENLSASVDLGGIGAGKHRLPVKVTNRTGASIVRQGMSVEVRLGKLKRAERHVRVVFFGSLRPGLAFGKVEYSPKKVEIYGKGERLKKVRLVRGGVDLTHRKESFFEKVGLVALGKDGVRVEGVRIHPPAVDLEVGLRSEGSKVVPVTARFSAQAGRPPGGFEAEIFPPVVSLLGEERVLADMESVETEPFDWRRCAGGGILSVELTLPAGVYSPVKGVRLSCSAPSLAERKIEVSLEPINMKEGTEVRLEPGVIEVILSGDAGALGEVSAADVSASVDVLGLEEGSHQAVPSVYLTREIRGIRLSTPVDRVRVIITGR